MYNFGVATVGMLHIFSKEELFYETTSKTHS